MSSRSAKDKNGGRRQHSEEEPFLVEEIPGSPIIRGKRQNSDEERLVVENISQSPVMRGRRQNSDEEPFVVRNIPRSPIMRGRRQNSKQERLVVDEMPPRGRLQNSDKEGFPVQNIPRSPGWRREILDTSAKGTDIADANRPPGWDMTSISSNSVTNEPPTTRMISPANFSSKHHQGPPDNDDAPPSYESSNPPNHFGWSPNITSEAHFAVPHQNERLTFAYPSSPCPPIELSPLAKSYLSIESPNSRSPEPSLSPSQSPSPERLRPAYTYQQIRIVSTPSRPQYRGDHGDEENFSVKPNNEFSYKYGGIVITVFVLIFMMLLSLAVKFFIRNSFT